MGRDDTAIPIRRVSWGLFSWRQSSWGKRDTAHCKKLINVNLNFYFLLYFSCVIIYKCDLFGLCRHGFWRIFLSFTVLIQTLTILKTIRLRRGGSYRRVMERGWRIAHCLIVFSLMTYAGGRTKSTGRCRVSRRFSAIQVGLCAVFVGCTVTCPRGFCGSTDTSRGSLDIRRML